MINSISHGDCLELMKGIPDNSVDMILADLPYEVTSKRNVWDKIIPFEPLWKEFNRIAKETAAMVFTATQPFSSKLVMSNLDDFKYEWIWEKQQGTGFLNAKKQPLRNHEGIYIYYRKQPTYNPQFTEGKPYICKSGKGSTNYNEQVSVVTENDGKRYPLTVIKFAYDKNKEHPTQKPVALMEYLIKTYTNEGDLILDPTCGSGTTCLAAKNLNRNFIGIEKELKYVEIANRRLLNEPELQK